MIHDNILSAIRKRDYFMLSRYNHDQVKTYSKALDELELKGVITCRKESKKVLVYERGPAFVRRLKSKLQG